MLTGTQTLTATRLIGTMTQVRPLDPTIETPVVADRRLLEQVAAGDERALALLYDRYSGPLYGIAYRITGERADAEEIVLECFSQAWRHADRFQSDKGSVIGWLTVICRSRSIDLIRARGRRAKRAGSAVAADPDQTPGMSRGERSPDSAVTQDERAVRVAAALEGLSAPQREAIQLAYFEGLSQSEIAERLNEPLGTVKTRVRLAMQKLRDVLRPYYFEAAT